MDKRKNTGTFIFGYAKDGTVRFSISLPGFAWFLMVQPLLLDSVMSYFRRNSAVTPDCAYVNATMFVTFMILPTVFFCHGVFRLNRLGLRARIAYSLLIYKKMLRLSSSTNRSMGSSITSLLTIDVAKFELFFTYAPFIFIVPMQLIVVIYFIGMSVGFITAAIGVGLMIVLTFPAQGIYSKLTLTFRLRQTAKTDNRVSLIGEIISGMKTIKMYVWEKYLANLIYDVRRYEISNYVKISYLSSIVWVFNGISHRLCTFVIMLTCVSQHGMITAGEILPVTLHLFNLQLSICIFFLVAVRCITDVHVSMKRIQDFLLLQEVNSNIQEFENNTGGLVMIEDVTASWKESSCLFRNINLNFTTKSVYAIVGPVGSGKSSLLKLILGELQTMSGKVYLRGRISYASQEPWLFNGSVKENILFGEKHEEERYVKVVKACGLSEDFTQLPNGDATLVGDRGGNLSGGQCARVNLARAVYRDADTYLLDDPLSAVDVQIAKKIIKDCINGVLANKIRILVTHNVQQLDGVKEVIFLEHGRIEFKGKMKDFQQSDRYTFQSMPDEPETTIKTVTNFQVNNLVIADTQVISNSKNKVKENSKLIPKETKKNWIYKSYIRAGGWTLLFTVILANFLFVMAVSSFDFKLADWTKNHDSTFSKNKSYDNSMGHVVSKSKLNSSLFRETTIVFGSLITLATLASILRNLLVYKFTLTASKNIHNIIFSRLMMTTLQFFEANSAGKILNRFSEDTGIIDNSLPLALFNAINTLFDVIAFLIPAITANWWIMIPCCITVINSFWIGKLYVGTIQKIKRLAGSARSPVISFATSSFAGVTTIRACRAENLVFKDFRYRIDHFTAAQFLTVALDQAFSLWIELINLGVFASIAYLCVFLKNDHTHEAYVGLSLIQVLSTTESISFMANQIAAIFAHVTSVERLLQLTELEKETLIEDEPEFHLSSSWPNGGEIVFQNLYLRYSSNNDPVLWNLNFKIEPGSKVGIVGRTGAGKSSLISTLFRFVKFDGSLFIDGVDVKKVNLYKLRSKISIIPQKPILFRTTLRKNLDPSDKLDDATLWSALENVELKKIFNSLEYPIEKGGNNLSIGQRQLLCLARAIINKNKILILDEATANVDSATDALIQTTIRRRFKECTVLTIAHRLNTIMDSDKILVLDKGRVIEYDYPLLLLQKNDSHFRKMVQQMDK